MPTMFQVMISACLLLEGVSSEKCGAAETCGAHDDQVSQDRSLLQTKSAQTKRHGQPTELVEEGASPSERKATVDDLAMPPLQGPLLWNMIRSEPWQCDLVPNGDPRQDSCKIDPTEDALKPENIACIERADHGLTCSIEHANSFRTMMQIGALPCCTTAPFCAAPTCAEVAAAALSKPSVCTKIPAQEYVDYMKQEDTWPAYHGWGGSFELDTLKFLDLLSCHGGSDCSGTPFDLSIDLGANTGYYSEKLSVRNWAKNYVMIEANPETSRVLYDRWGNDAWRHTWFTKQVHLPEGQAVPEVAIITKPLSNHSDGVLDMCATEGSMANAAAGCIVPIKKVDDILPEELNDNFREHFKKAQSAYLKVDTEGMDELVLRGMDRMFKEKRGKHEDGSDKYLINFLQLEYSPALMQVAKKRESFTEYDLHSVTKFLESIGFESFMIGPRYLPLSHGSWSDEFKTWTEDAANNAGKQTHYPNFKGGLCPYCKDMPMPSFTSDIFAIRSSHPRATQIKVALGACKESNDFDVHDNQYNFEKTLEMVQKHMDQMKK